MCMHEAISSISESNRIFFARMKFLQCLTLPPQMGKVFPLANLESIERIIVPQLDPKALHTEEIAMADEHATQVDRFSWKGERERE